ncbi:MAG: PAS domain S-box protein [Nitrospira sp.]
MQDITERKRAQEVAAHFAAVVGSSFDAIISKTLDGVVTSWNAAAERMFGYSAAEMIGQTVCRLIPADLPDEEAHILECISRGETLHHYETVRLTKDGRRLDLSLTISPIADPNGRIIGASKIARDITEQKRQRTALKESEELFRALVDQMSQLAWMMDHTGLVYWFNRRWYEYTGMTSETVQGLGWQQVHHPDHLERVLNSRRRSIETGELWEETFPIRGKDGEYRWFLTRAVPIRDDQGRIARWFGTNTDITEHKRTEEDLRTAEQALRESDTRFRELVERSPFGIYVVDAEFRIAHMNEAGQKGAFCNVRPVIGRDIGEAMRILWPEPVAADIIEQFRHTLETGIPYRSRNFINPRADLEQTEGYEWELHRLTLPDGRHGVICYYYDSTRLRMVEAALRESGAQLQAAAADLEKRVEERTHELVRSQADLRALASELNLTEQRERKRLAGELHDHLQQMLVFGKLQLGRGMLRTGVDPECMEIIRDVHGMLSEALTYTHTLVAELCPPVLREHGLIAGLRWLAGYMKRYGMKVTVRLPDEEDLALPEDWTILLFQSVRELLMNAHKYAGTGMAEVALMYGQGALMIHVQDRGKGFDSAAATSADLTVGGSSSKFGLFSIKERMRTLGGSFAIASVLGRGTTATLRLPLTSRAADGKRVSGEREVLPGTPAVRLSQGGTQPIRVLLVDDHVMIRQGLRAVLEAYSDIELIGEAGNGEEAVALVDRLEPSVVVMDISMPKMNGIEATGRITTRHPALAVIGLSVNASVDNQTAMLKAGARQLLTKEAAVKQLYGAIKDAVGLSA